MYFPVTSLTRRELLIRAGAGFGGVALTGLLHPEIVRASAKAKSIIFLFMYGGPSQVDLFDPKPELARHHGKPMTGKGAIDVFFGNPGNLMASPYSFKKYGQSGIDVSELFPNVAECVDDLCVIRSLHTTSNNHSPAIFMMNSGNMRPGNPCLGSWMVYGLGTENKNLPSFVVMYDWRGGPIGGAPNWSSGFMPAGYQGTAFRTGNTPIVDLTPPKSVDPHRQRAEIDFIQKLNEEHRKSRPGNSDLEARVASYELAFQMQTHAPEAVDISKETSATTRLYGIGEKTTDYYGRQCLTARRLVERGVRFVQLYSGGGHQQESWDAHYGLDENHRMHCAETDKPIAGLLRDLKAKGLLDSTLVVWGGEFGRMPISQSCDWQRP